MIKRILAVFNDSTGSFEGREEGEEIVLLLRHHPFNIFMKISITGIGAILPIFAGVILWPTLSTQGLIALFIFGASLWYLLLWLAVFYALTMYSLDTMIVTNHRVIDQDQLGFFNRHVAELHISRIQDIAVHTRGIMETFFKFGDVNIQTASSEVKFTFPRIPNPEQVKNTIMNIVRERHSDVRRM
jgi:uncharacterized membrane protein YdbT with pleckstrin-like domain